MTALRWMICGVFAFLAFVGAMLAVFPQARGPRFTSDDLIAAIIFALLALIVKP